MGIGWEKYNTLILAFSPVIHIAPSPLIVIMMMMMYCCCSEIYAHRFVGILLHRTIRTFEYVSIAQLVQGVVRDDMATGQLLGRIIFGGLLPQNWACEY